MPQCPASRAGPAVGVASARRCEHRPGSCVGGELLRPRPTLPIASLLFFFSGALGLGYQLVWVKKSALLVGSSHLALSTVLTSFFLGLGLGSFAVGRALRSERWSPLFVYGLFEIAIGLFALGFPLLFSGVGGVYGAVYPFVQDSGFGLYAVRFLLLFLLFLVPTFFMGGTLPLLLDGLVERDDGIGPLTGRLYGLNILGAVGGVLATAYICIPRLGMNGTSVAFGCGNLLIGAVAVAAFRRERPLHTASGPDARSGLGVFYPVLAFCSGLAAIGYQVFWARYFNLIQESSVYFVGLLLAVYLLALSIGSLLSGWLTRLGVRPLRAVSLLQPAVPLLVLSLLTAWVPARHFFVVGPHFEAHANWALVSEVWDAILIAPALQIALVIFLPVIAIGTGLPLLISAATRHSSELRERSGTLVFWNTVGSSAGGFLVGFVSIPAVGLTGALLAMGLVSIGLGAAAEWRLGRDAQPGGAGWRRLRVGYVAAVLALLLVVFRLPLDLARWAVETYGWGTQTSQAAELVDLVEGPLTTAWVYREPEHLRIGSGRVALAQAWFDHPSPQMIQGHLPVLFHPRPGIPRRALGIAVGSGQAFGALLHYPIEQLDVVDISSEMLSLSFEHFARFNNGLGRDPRVRVHLDDGRHFVSRAPDATYDIVTTEPPPPSDEGVYALYSVEFYHDVHRILREGGVFLQWLPLYMVTPEDLRGLLRTQHVVFPHTFVMRSANRDFAILSFKGERPVFRRDWIAERARYFARERHIEGRRWARSCPLEIVAPESIMAMILTGPEDLAALDSAPIYHDDDQQLSYSSGDRQLLRRYRHDVAALSFAALPLTPFEQLETHFDGPLDVALLEEQRACALKPFRMASPSAIAEQIARLEASDEPGERASAALAVAELHARSLALAPAIEWLERAIDAHPGDSRPASLETARRVVRPHAALFGGEIRSWLAGLSPEQRQSRVARAIADELAGFEDRAAAERSRYWFAGEAPPVAGRP